MAIYTRYIKTMQHKIKEKEKQKKFPLTKKKKKKGKIEEDRKFSSQHLDLFGVDTK